MFILASCSGKPHSSTNLQISAEKFTLDNGMTVVISPDTSMRNISIQAWVKSGTLYEDKLVGTGVSHFVEHLLFESKSSHAYDDMAKEIKRYGGNLNAYTSADKTVFYINMMGENYDKGLTVLYNALFKSEISEEVFNKEKNVIYHEIRGNKDDVKYRIVRKLFTKIYQNHPYSMPIAGHEDLLKRLSYKKTMRYYKKRYHPANMTLVVTGNFKQDELKQKIQDIFGKEPRGINSLKGTSQLAIHGFKTKEIVKDDDTNLVYTILGYRGVPIFDKDTVILDLISIMLGQGKTSILYKDLKDEKETVHEIFATYYSMYASGLFAVLASCEPEYEDNIEKGVLENIENFKYGKFADKDLKTAKNSIKSSYIFSCETLNGRSAVLGTSEFYFQDPYYYKTYLNLIDNITKADVVRVANKYLDEDNLSIVVSVPEEEEEEEVVSQLKIKGKQEEVSPELKIDKYELDNGIKLLVCEKKGIPIVNIRACMIGGLLLENKENNGVCELFSRMLIKGTEIKDARKIAEYVEQRGGSITSYSGKNSIGLEMNFLSEDLNNGIDLLKEILYSAKFRKKQFAKEKVDLIMDLYQEKEDMFTVGYENLKSTFFGDYPYGMNPKGNNKSVIKIGLDDVQEMYKKVVVPNNLVISVFGDVDSLDVKKQIENKFEAFLEKNTFETSDIVTDNTKCEKEISVTMPKRESVVMLGFPSCRVGDMQHRHNMEVISEMCSGMGGILYDKIRKKNARAYALGAFNVLGLYPGVFVFYVFTDKDSIETVKQTVLEVIQELKQGKIDDLTLEVAKNSLVGEYYDRLEQNSELSFDTILDELYDIGIEDALNYDKIIKQVKKEDVVFSANTFFSEEDMVVSTVVGEK